MEEQVIELDLFLEVSQVKTFMVNEALDTKEQYILKRTMYIEDIYSYQEDMGWDVAKEKWLPCRMIKMNNGEEIIVKDKYANIKKKIDDFYLRRAIMMSNTEDNNEVQGN